MSENQRPSGGDSHKFFGDYIGKVESIADPKKLLRVQVRVYGVFTDSVPARDLPWAEMMLPLGARPNDGLFIPMRVGDFVQCKFIEGDTRRPVILGSVHHAPGSQPNLPHEAWQGPSPHAHKRTGTEPAQPAHGYHEDVVFTQNGCTIEMNKDGSVAVYQRSSGSEVCISANGDIVIHGESNLHFSSVTDTNGEVGADLNITVAGNTTINTSGNTDIHSDGPLAISSNGSSTITSTGTIGITVAQLNLTGNMHVDGSIDATGTIIDGGGNTPNHSHG